MRNKNVLYESTKPHPLDIPPTWEEWKSLFNNLQIEENGITYLPKKKIIEISDREFCLLCIHPKIFIKIDDDTLIYIKERSLQLGLSYAVDSKLKVTQTFNGKEKHL